MVAVGIGSIAYVATHRPAKSTRKVVYDGTKEPTQDISEGLINVPKDAKSATCEVYPAQKIESIFGVKTSGARVSVPTTKTTEGTVSACAYVVSDNGESPVRSLIITSREFSDPQKARKSYDILDNFEKDKKVKDGKTTYVNHQGTQVVGLNKNTLIVISFSFRSSSDSLKKDIYSELMKLINK